MANGFDPSKITKQLRSPRNLLEFADISIQPRQVSTAEVIADTLDNAFERASQTYLQGKQLDSQVQQQQIQSDLRREQLDIEQERYQRSEDKSNDKVLMDSLEGVDLKTEDGVKEVKFTISEMSDPKLRGILTSRVGVAIESATKLSQYEEIFQGQNFNEILTNKYTFRGEEKEGKELLDEYVALNPTGKGMFGVSKDKMLVEMTSKYRGNAEYFNFAYGKYKNDKGETQDKLDRLGFNDSEKEEFRALSPDKGMQFLTNKLSQKGVNKNLSDNIRNLENSISNRRGLIDTKQKQISADPTKSTMIDKLQGEILDLQKEISGYDTIVDNLYSKAGLGVTPTKDKNKVITGNINSFKGLNKLEQQSFLQNHSQLTEIRNIVNTYSSKNKDLSLTSPEFLDSLSKIGIFNDTIKTTQGFPSIPGNAVVDSGTVKTTTTEQLLADVPRPSIPIPTDDEDIADDVTLDDLDFDEFEKFVEPAVITPKKIKENPNEYVANNPITASGMISKDINKLTKETNRLQKFKKDGQSQAIIKSQNKKIKNLEDKIKNKFFGYISSETGNFSNQNYTDKFYNSLSSKTKQSPQKLKTLMQIITSSR